LPNVDLLIHTKTNINNYIPKAENFNMCSLTHCNTLTPSDPQPSMSASISMEFEAIIPDDSYDPSASKN
jgi:hypothetical protein